MALWRFLISLKTCAWAGVAFCLAGAVGSVVMGRYPGLFADMDAQVFAGWFARKGFAAPAPTLRLKTNGKSRSPCLRRINTSSILM